MTDDKRDPIAAGKARLAVALAYASLVKAIGEVETAALAFEATAVACARALDATVPEGSR